MKCYVIDYLSYDEVYKIGEAWPKHNFFSEMGLFFILINSTPYGTLSSWITYDFFLTAYQWYQNAIT